MDIIEEAVDKIKKSKKAEGIVDGIQITLELCNRDGNAWDLLVLYNYGIFSKETKLAYAEAKQKFDELVKKYKLKMIE